MNVLLSIKPEFAEKILTGEKRYEFRRSSFRDSTAIGSFFMYASSPVQRIVGEFTMDEIINESPASLWRKYGTESGIKDRNRFMAYFDGVDSGYAIQIDQTRRMATPIDPWESIENFRPPVSFQYVNGELSSILSRYSPTSQHSAHSIPDYS